MMNKISLKAMVAGAALLAGSSFADTDDFEGYAVGNTLSTPLSGGTGWVGNWVTANATTASGIVRDSSQLNNDGQYLEVDLTNTSGGQAMGIGRGLSGGAQTQDYSVTFLWRADTLGSFSTSNDRFEFYSSSSSSSVNGGGSGGNSSTTPYLMGIFGAGRGSNYSIGGRFGVYNPVNTGDGFDQNRYFYLGSAATGGDGTTLTLVAGTTYSVTIDIHIASKTWDVSVTDGSTTAYSTGIKWWGASTQPYIGFGCRGDAASETRSFSIDTIEAGYVPPPPPFSVTVSPEGITNTSPVLTAVVVNDGSEFSSAVLSLDGSPVATNSSPAGVTNTVSYAASGLALGSHTADVVVNGINPAATVTNSWAFLVEPDGGYTPLEDTETMYLSGTGSDDTVDWDFYCTGGQNSGVWTTIPVPSCWELQGFGAYNYGLDSSPASEQGLYKHSFVVPTEWAGQQIQLVFEGSMTDTDVKINGVSAGAVHQGAFTQFRYDIETLLNYGGTNLLEVTVSKRSSNSSVNTAEREADYWIFGGIFRPVLLEARPQTSLQRVAIDAQNDGSLLVNVDVNDIDEALSLYAWVDDAQEQQVGSAFTAALAPLDTTATLSTSLAGITPWTMENPVLYTLNVELRDGTNTLHSLSQRFGFRTIELLAGDGLYLNGTKIRVKGVDRHVFHPDFARTSSRALSEEAVELIKGMNMNAIRMSHYPPDQHMLDVCDEEGMLVVNELPGWQTSYDTPSAERLVQEMVERDVNHPSVIFWSNGNEGGWNSDVDDDFDLYDPQQRPVIHAIPQWGGTMLNGLDTTHYQNYSTLISKLDGPNLYMPTEFLHGLYDGGHGAGLQDYWDAMHASPDGVGGFLWVFADEGVRRTDLGGLIDNDGNHAADGLVGPYNEKEPSYFAVRDIWSPIVLTDPSITAGWDGQVDVMNDYYFTDLDECTVQWEFGNFPALSGSSQTGLVVSTEGSVSLPSLTPQASGTLQVPLAAGWNTNDALRLTAFNPDGDELRTWTWTIRTQAEIAAASLPDAPVTTAGASEDADIITLSGGDVEVVISKTSGRITSVTRDGSSVALSNGPRIVSGSSSLTGISLSQSGNDQVVEATYSGNLNSITYTMRDDGWMRIDTSLNITGDQSNIGVTFDYPEGEVESMRWLGGGPNPVWKNRLAGTPLGVWEKTANNPIPGQTYITEPTFRGYHRDFRWGEITTSEACIKIVPETSDMFLHLLTPANGVSPMDTQFTMPSGNISLLHAVSPIGTKFFPANQLGPMSEPNVGAGSYSASFWLAVEAVDARITGVDVVSPYRIQVNFNQAMEAAALDAASYSIPGLLVHGVEAGSGNAVLLDIQPLEAGVSYTLDVASLTSASGDPLSGDQQFALLYEPQVELDLPFNTSAGGSSPDVSGNGRDATLGSGTSLASAWRAQGLQLPAGGTSYANVSLPAMSAFTVEAWVKLNNADTTWPRLISMNNENVQVFFDYNSGNSIGLNVKGRGDWRSTANVLPAFGTWFHVAVSFDTADAAPTFYLNGEELTISSSADSAGTYGTGGTAVIGNRADGGRGVNGVIDEFRIESRAVEASEISTAAAEDPTESFDDWATARGYPGAAPGEDADGNGEPDLVDYLAAAAAGQSVSGVSVLQLQEGLLGYSFRVGKVIENVDWQIETSTNLVAGAWEPVPADHLYPWRDLGSAIEYVAVPATTNALHCFSRLGVTPQ